MRRSPPHRAYNPTISSLPPSIRNGGAEEDRHGRTAAAEGNRGQQRRRLRCHRVGGEDEHAKAVEERAGEAEVLEREHDDERDGGWGGRARPSARTGRGEVNPTDGEDGGQGGGAERRQGEARAPTARDVFPALGLRGRRALASSLPGSMGACKLPVESFVGSVARGARDPRQREAPDLLLHLLQPPPSPPAPGRSELARPCRCSRDTAAAAIRFSATAPVSFSLTPCSNSGAREGEVSHHGEDVRKEARS
jgi:hypothetical protein